LSLLTPPVRSARLVATALWSGLALLVASAVAAQPSAPGFALERVERFAQLPPGGVLTVENSFGDVVLRFGGYAGVVEARATLQQFADEGAPLVLEVSEGPAGVQVRVGVRSATASALALEPTKGQKKRADLVLFVPQGARLAVTALDGRFEARGVRGDLKARTRGGAITVRGTRGDLDLESTSGAIVAVPESLGRTAVQRFASASGDVTLHLVEDGSFAVRAETAGWLSTDFSLSVERDADRKRGSARIGTGATPIHASSGSGHIRLVRRPSAALAGPDAPEEAP
jgi:Putative adhesin